MASQREQIEDWELGQLVDAIGNENAYAASARAELLRREALNQDRAALAQERAADAQEAAAFAAKEIVREPQDHVSCICSGHIDRPDRHHGLAHVAGIGSCRSAGRNKRTPETLPARHE